MTPVEETYTPPKRSAEYEKLQQAIELEMVGMEGFEPSTCSDFKSDVSAIWTTFP